MFRYVLFIGLLICGFTGSTQPSTSEEHTKAALRSVGHEILLLANDTSSRVLPITIEDNKYKISFENPFQFDPELLTKKIDSIIQQTKLVESYIVEVEQCSSLDIVYSYEVSPFAMPAPCQGRVVPLGCYHILFSPLDTLASKVFTPVNQSSSTEKKVKYQQNYSIWIIVSLLIVAVLGIIFLKRKKQSVNSNPDIIILGNYQFDTKNMELVLQQQKTELTGKEADLLLLLHENINNTVKRDILLKEIWEDEGDYIGRTLDVYISKLRKKLEADPQIKIINVRGVGYKMILND